MKIKSKIAAVAAAMTISGVAGVAASPPEPAQAAWMGTYRVASWSSTCLSMYDHIDQYGNPYGTRVSRCPGQTFPTGTDWDYVVWSYGYKLRYAGQSPVPIATSGEDYWSGHKFSTYSIITMGTVRK